MRIIIIKCFINHQAVTRMQIKLQQALVSQNLLILNTNTYQLYTKHIILCLYICLYRSIIVDSDEYRGQDYYTLKSKTNLYKQIV
jgi:hypothetical protein